MNNIKRIKIIQWLLVAVFFSLLIYILVLQTVYSKKYELKASGQHTDSIPLLAERGKIFDTKNRPLAYNRLCASIRILPQYIRCRDSVIDLLASYNLKSKDDIADELKSKTRLFSFKKVVDYSIASKLKKELRLVRFDNSIIVADDLKRIYPFGQTVGSIVGFLGDESGLAGIEFYFDNILRGKAGCRVLQKDAMGNDYCWPSYPIIPPSNGYDLVLTIDLDIQEIAYKELSRYVENFQAIRGSVLVIDAHDGAILAMCDYPDFDPQNYKNYPANSWTASAISDEFEPGSVYKIIICATALESDKRDVLRTQKYDVSKGFIKISGKKIKDVHNNGIIDFNDIFIKSSNIGVSMLSQILSPTSFYLMERKMGFSIVAGIELPGEAKGFIDPPKLLTPLRFANNGFGQGVRATLLQLSMAYLAIAQDGLLLKPYLIKEIIRRDRTVYQGKKKVVRRVLDKTNARMIKDILAQAVSQGTGKSAQLDNYQVCGKTGTSQKIEPDGKYSQEKSIMTFIGFLPKANPRYLVAVLIDEPKISRFAGQVTCPLFRDIALKILRLENPQVVSTDPGLVIH